MKPHIRHAVSVDCGWRYEHWICYDMLTDTRAIGGTPKEAYKRMLLQRSRKFRGYDRSTVKTWT